MINLPPPLQIARQLIWQVIDAEITDRRLHRGFKGQVLRLPAQDGTTLIRFLIQNEEMVIVPRFRPALWYGEPNLEMRSSWFEERAVPDGIEWTIKQALGVRSQIMEEFIRAYARWQQGRGRY